MEKFDVIVENIQAVCSKLKNKEREKAAIIDSCNLIKKDSKVVKAYEDAAPALAECAECIRRLKLEKLILQNNARVALFNEVMPVALEVLKKYIGKPYGEKTKQKISDEVEEKTGCRFYIDKKYSSYDYTIYSDRSDEYNIACGTKYSDGTRKLLLIDNKIQSVDFSDLEIYYISDTYIEDVSGRIKDILAKHQEAFKLKEQLEKICSEYNHLIVGEMPRLYAGERIYSDIQF